MDKLFAKPKKDTEIRKGNLEIVWIYRTDIDKIKKIKTYIVACVCGSTKMLIASAAVRCYSCGRGSESYEFEKLSIEANRLSLFNDGRRGKIKQKVNKQKTLLRVNAKTGEMGEVSDKEFLERCAKRSTINYTCNKCKKVIPWTGLHYYKGISPPLVFFGGEEMCFPCLRNKLKAEK